MILLCKTILSDATTKLVNVPGYKLYSDPRKNHKGSVTAILVRNDTITKRRLDLTVFHEKEIESTFIEIQAKNGKSIVLGSIYGPQNGKEGNFVNEIIKLNHKVKNEKKEMILGMDHNLDLLKSSEHKMTQNFLNCLLENNMLPTNMRPTRITHNTATLIDNIFVSSKLYRDFESALILNDMSDHLPVLTLLKQTKFVDKTSLEFKSRNLNESNLSQIKAKLFEVDWNGLLSANACDKNVNIFCNKISTVMDSISPEKTIRISHKQEFVEPLMSHGIEVASRKKLELHKKTLHKDVIHESVQKYKEYRNHYNRLKRTTQTNYYTEKIRECKNRTKELLKVINKVTGKTKHRVV